jgi:acyl carrier protein
LLTHEQIRQYIVDEMLEDADIEITNSTSLFQERVLDSLNLLRLIDYLESSAKIKIASSEIALENIDSIDLIVTFIAGKMDS